MLYFDRCILHIPHAPSKLPANGTKHMLMHCYHLYHELRYMGSSHDSKVCYGYFLIHRHIKRDVSHLYSLCR